MTQREEDREKGEEDAQIQGIKDNKLHDMQQWHINA